MATLQRREGLELLDLPAWVDAAEGQLAVRTEMLGESVVLLQVRW